MEFKLFTIQTNGGTGRSCDVLAQVGLRASLWRRPALIAVQSKSQDVSLKAFEADLRFGVIRTDPAVLDACPMPAAGASGSVPSVSETS
ncbi:hypothetical protein GCM10007301_43440 [Azorhizobium oxalatiphilum]|uniref:Uncharacterized protein n=1 Tax=Azorhizobium oxalatiphilum TaxID=980631 RepID=A0A917FI07_9HYPH|nr:hypothetical protein GCM10007301_43440 [Azorhizobium oxalatiphilum]